MLLKNKLENGITEFGMDVPFQKELSERGKEAKAAFAHSEKCKRNRESRRKKFDKVRIVYFNLMALLTGIILISVCRIMYDVIRIAKMQ